MRGHSSLFTRREVYRRYQCLSPISRVFYSPHEHSPIGVALFTEHQYTVCDFRHVSQIEQIVRFRGRRSQIANGRSV